MTGPLKAPDLQDGALSYRFSGSYTNGGQFIDFINNSNVFLAPAVTWSIDGATSLTIDGQYTHLDAQQYTGIPAIGQYPADLPIRRSLQEPNEPPDTVRNALIAEEFKHTFDQNWTITSRFLAARNTLESDDLIGNCFALGPNADPNFPGPCTDQNGSALPPQDTVREIIYQKLVGTNYSATLDLTGKFYALGAKNDALIGADYFYQFYDYLLSFDGNFPINVFNPIYGTVPTAAFQAAPFLAQGNESGLTRPGSD